MSFKRWIFRLFNFTPPNGNGAVVAARARLLEEYRSSIAVLQEAKEELGGDEAGRVNLSSQAVIRSQFGSDRRRHARDC